MPWRDRPTGLLLSGCFLFLTQNGHRGTAFTFPCLREKTAYTPFTQISKHAPRLKAQWFHSAFIGLSLFHLQNLPCLFVHQHDRGAAQLVQSHVDSLLYYHNISQTIQGNQGLIRYSEHLLPSCSCFFFLFCQ